MSNQKKKIALSVLSVLVVLAMVLGTTFAWFTDVETADLNFKAGVLNITVTDPTNPESAELTFDNLRPLTLEQFDAELTDEIKNLNTEGFAPEPVYFRAVKIANEGTLPAKLQLSLTAVTPNDTVKNILRTDDGHVEQVADPATVACTNKLAEVIKVFLYELDDETGKWTRVEGVNLNTVTAGDDATSYEPAAMLGAGEDRTYVIGGYLPETVGNDYQAKHFHGALWVGAGQLDEGAPIGKPDGSGDPDPDPQDMTIKVIFNDKATGTKVDETTLTVKDNQFPYTVTTAMVAAPTGYHYDPAEQSRVSTLTEGVASDVTFTVTEDADPDPQDVTIKVIFNDKETGTKVDETTLTVKDNQFPYTVTTAMVAAPTGYHYDPAEQSQVSTLTEGVASDVVFTVTQDSTVDPDQDYNYTVTVQYKEGDTVRKEQTLNLTEKGNVTSYTVNADMSWVTVRNNNYTSSGKDYDYELASGESSSKVVTLNPEDGTTSPEPVIFKIKTGLYASGTGSVDDPYMVSNAIEFDNIRYAVNKNFKLANSISLAGGNTRGYFDTIGLGESADVPFTGTLDGDGNTVSDIKIDYGTEYNNVGIFAENAGTVKNITLKTNTATDADGVCGGNTVGILAGTNSGLVSNVHVSGASSGIGSGSGELSKVGLLVGVNADSGTIEYSSATNGSVTGYSYVGGLVGQNYGAIKESYSTADVNDLVTAYTLANTDKYFMFIGGFVGGNAGTIENSYAVPEAAIKGNGGIGAFAGLNTSNGIIKNCYTNASGKITYNDWNNYGYITLGVGKNSATVTNFYYVGSTATSAGTIMTESALKSATSLTGFSTSVWNFGTSSQYPDLINNPR
ncbi:hypothetical protein H8711_06950 [Clostridiaceae bacterium NSJ-31]|uniref:GLUG domain-containing protein n=1 Tax=Ligaoa zhengdingensis TaxID=2763658 RepID=A0A926DZJ8_9FIRM|nr:hypothetical protein [Ligaoa zhengdingensis]